MCGDVIVGDGGGKEDTIGDGDLREAYVARARFD